jgi:trehalose 6-phosphate phosphatase
VRIDKGLAVRQVLGERRYAAVLYVGDDTTDLDAFRAVRALARDGSVGQAICVGVNSAEAPAGVTGEADLMVRGTDGVRDLLAALAAS